MENRTARRPFVHRARWAVVLVTTATTVAVWAVAVQAVGDLVVQQGGGERTVDQLSVVLTALGAGFLAWASLTLLERVTRRSRGVWLGLAVVVLVLSLAGPLTATTATATVVLAGLHLLVGGMLVVGMLVVAPRLADQMGRRRRTSPAGAVR